MCYCQALITYRARNARGRLVRLVETVNLCFAQSHVSLKELAREAAEAVKGFDLTQVCDQVDIVIGGEVKHSFVVEGRPHYRPDIQ